MNEDSMPAIDPHSVSTRTFDWGAIKWLISPECAPGAGLTFGEVVLLPGRGHARHNHPTAEEVLYVLSGTGEQMVSDGPPFDVHAGDTIYIPRGEYHSTLNTGWQTMRLLALYNPAGAEHALESLPDYGELPAGQQLGWTRG
jgi:oxalate decarboxylase/phosphoglucose isomerase-like protein (cupin superfamily)